MSGPPTKKTSTLPNFVEAPWGSGLRELGRALNEKEPRRTIPEAFLRSQSLAMEVAQAMTMIADSVVLQLRPTDDPQRRKGARC